MSEREKASVVAGTTHSAEGGAERREGRGVMKMKVTISPRAAVLTGREPYDEVEVKLDTVTLSPEDRESLAWALVGTGEMDCRVDERIRSVDPEGLLTAAREMQAVGVNCLQPGVVARPGQHHRPCRPSS
jgi:hypothetical protein